MNPQSFETHEIWSTCLLVSDLIQEVSGVPGMRTDDERQAMRTISSMVEYLNGFRNTDPVIWADNSMESANESLLNVNVHLSNYLEQASSDLLISAGAEAINVISAARMHFPVFPQNEQSADIAEATISYRKVLDNEIQGLVRLLGLERERANSALEHSQRVEAEVQSKTGEFNSVVDALRQRLEQQIASQAENFQSEVGNRTQAHADVLDKLQAESRGRFASIDSQAEAVFIDVEAQANASLAKIGELHEQAKALVDATSKHAVSGQYSTWAAYQAKAARIWEGLALFVGLVTVGGTVWLVTTAESDSIQFTVYKFTIAVLAAGLFGYVAKQAASRREQERKYKRDALDLAALEPFLANLPELHATALRQQFAARMFAARDSSGSENAVLIPDAGNAGGDR